MRKARAVFLDRDGVLNDLVYHEEEGRVLSPFSSRELYVFPFVPSAIKAIREQFGFKAIVISNQPGVAKKQFTYEELQRMNEKVRRALATNGSTFDGEYYCLHHPSALVAKYRVDCECRKPKPGMLLQAAREHNLDLETSYFMGDSLIDIKAGKRAGCKTVFVGHVTGTLTLLMDREEARPDHVIHSLKDAPGLLAELEGDGGVRSGARRSSGRGEARDALKGVGSRPGRKPRVGMSASPSRGSLWTICG